jgi:hypothetical protein
MFQRDTRSVERVDELEYLLQCADEWLHFGDLRADVHVDAGDPHAGERRCLAIQRKGFVVGDTELALAQSRGDVGMGLGVDVRIDAQRNGGLAPHVARNPVQAFDFAVGLHVEAQDSGGERGAHLGFGLAHPGEDSLRRGAAGGEHPRQLATRYDIEAGAKPGKQVEDGEVGICLHRVADQHVPPGASRGEFVPCGLEGGPRVDVARRAELLGDGLERHRFDAQCPVAQRQRVHLRCGSLWAGFWSGGGRYNGPLVPQACRTRHNSTRPAAKRGISFTLESIEIIITR